VEYTRERQDTKCHSEAKGEDFIYSNNKGRTFTSGNDGIPDSFQKKLMYRKEDYAKTMAGVFAASYTVR